MVTKEYQSTASISVDDFRQYISGRCIIGFFSLRMKTLDCQKQNVNKYVQAPCISSTCMHQEKGFCVRRILAKDLLS